MAEDRDDGDIPDVVKMAHRFWRESRDHSSSWRAEAREDYDMVAGDQWDADTLADLKDQQRPTVTFNRILRTINVIIGSEINNRQETRFIPREPGDVQVNEILTNAAEWVRDETDTEDEESDAFEDLCTTGMGWTETFMDYSSEPDGIARTDRRDPLEMYWDPGSTKRNLTDARWVMHVRQMGQAEFEEEWPDADVDTAGNPWDSGDDDGDTRTHVYPQDAYREQQGMGSSASSQKKIRVAHLQWAEKTTTYRVGKRAASVSAEQYGRLEGKLKERDIPTVKQHGVRWKRAFVAGNTVLEESSCPYDHGPTFKAMTYKRDRNKNTWFGIVRAMKDPQRWGNKFFSQILDILNKGAKGGIMVESDAVEDIRELENTWARPDAVHKFKPGALSQNKIMPKPVVDYPVGLDRLMAFSMDAVHEVTGVNLELMGFADRDQPGVLEHQRKQAGLTILAPLFNSLRRYRKEQGRVMLHFIQTFLSDGRLIRIMGEQGLEKYVPLTRQESTVHYDVIVDESPTSPNMRERVFGAMVQMMPMLGKMGIPLPPELLDYAPIPTALAVSWKGLIENNQAADPEQMKQQLEEGGKMMQQLQKENAALKDKSAETQMEFQLKQAEFQSGLQQKQAEMQMEQQAAQAEHQLKIELMSQEIELKRAEMEAKIALAREEAQMSISLETAKVDANIELAERKAASDAALAAAKIEQAARSNGGAG